MSGSGTNRFPLFVVLERETPCETPLGNGTCFVVAQKMITSGRAGEEAVMVWKVDNAPLSEVDQQDNEFVNTVLRLLRGGEGFLVAVRSL